MFVTIRAFTPADIAAANRIWNQVVEDGVAYPQLNCLTEETGLAFFARQDYVGLACDEAGQVVGLYILHPNNEGRCGHICNASYAVERGCRGQHVGEALVRHCLAKGKELGYRILQFNAVVATNTRALALYKKLGFVHLGTIPGGFLMPDGHYEDIVPMYHEL